MSGCVNFFTLLHHICHDGNNDWRLSPEKASANFVQKYILHRGGPAFVNNHVQLKFYSESDISLHIQSIDTLILVICQDLWTQTYSSEVSDVFLIKYIWITNHSNQIHMKITNHSNHMNFKITNHSKWHFIPKSWGIKTHTPIATQDMYVLNLPNIDWINSMACNTQFCNLSTQWLL